MNPLKCVDSLAVFGSVPRGDADSISDKDVLVAAEYSDLQVESSLVSAGYSPSFYSWEQLQNLAKDGSLFLQHLKQESHIVIDRHGQLSDLLSDYRPKGDYSQRITENLLLFEITNGVPDSPFALGWAFDVLAVALRNHAILELAQSGNYIFSYSALIAKLASIHQLSELESRLLLDLRRRKRDYRNSPYVADASLATLQRTQAVVERLTGANCLSLRLSPRDFVARLLKVPHHSVHWYCLLRRYEGVHRAMGFAPLNDSTSELCEIERVFAKPSPYSGTGSDSIAWVRGKVDALAQTWLSEPSALPRGASEA